MQFIVDPIKIDKRSHFREIDLFTNHKFGEVFGIFLPFLNFFNYGFR